MPIFRKKRREYENSNYFDGKDIGIAHVYAANTLPLIDCIYSAGADVGLIKDNGNAHDNDVIDLLEELQVKWESPNHQFDYVIDCTGYFASPQHKPKIGAVEVTRSGIHKYRENKILDDIILIDVDNSKCKLIETFLGNPHAVLKTLKHFKGSVEELLENNLITIIGFGKIGRGLASIFKKYAKIQIVDIDDDALDVATSLGFVGMNIDKMSKSEISQRVGNSDIIFTSTGRKGVMTKYFDKNLLDNSLKINVGAVDEWGEKYNEEEVYLSKHKPFNFNLEPPTNSKYIDPILTLQLEGLNYLIQNEDDFDIGYHTITKSIDQSIFDIFNNIYKGETKYLNKYFQKELI